MSTRAARERFTFETPDHLWAAAKAICVELNREYPYLAEFQMETDDRLTLFSLYTIKRSISRSTIGGLMCRHADGEMISNTGWDVDWIKGLQEYAYHQSSGGGSFRHAVSGIYWRHPLMLHAVREETARYCNKAFRKRNRTRPLRRIPPDLLEGHEDLMLMLENTGIESEVYYCQICEDYLPDRPEDQCEHVWDCDEDAVLRGPGSVDYPEPCDSEDCWHCSRQRVTV